jgi:UDP-N-acetylglucosamine acyltransferase
MDAVMTTAHSPQIHPTAVISPEAVLAEGVSVGACAVIEGAVRIGPNCTIRPHAVLVGPLTMGCGNSVYSGAVLGERPQHMQYRDEPTSLEIGDNNTFRENVTVHRGTAHTGRTVLGNGNFLMAGSHIAHDCVVGNNCILANGALVAGHCTLEDSCYLSGNCAIHQFTRVGRLALLSGLSTSVKDIPPFIVQQGINCVVGVNIVGMRRAGMSRTDISAVRRAFQLLYLEGHTVPAAMELMNSELAQSAAVQEMLTFLRGSQRGINGMRNHGREAA